MAGKTLRQKKAMIRTIREYSLYRYSTLNVDITHVNDLTLHVPYLNDYIREYATFYDILFHGCYHTMQQKIQLIKVLLDVKSIYYGCTFSFTLGSH